MFDSGATFIKLCNDWQHKKKANTEQSEHNEHDRLVTIFPVREFQKSSAIMGVRGFDFWTMCMYDYQNLVASHNLINGLTEDGTDPNEITADVLDALYKEMGVS